MCPPEAFGAQTLGQEVVLHLWNRLLAAPGTTSTAVIEADRPIHGSRLVGFGGAAFVTEAFAAAALSQPAPWLNRRILQAMLDGRSPILTAEELRRDNTLGALNLVTMSGYIRPACEDDVDLVRRVSSALANAFYRAHLGFRLRRLLYEVTEQVMRQRMHRMARYTITGYPDGGAAGAPVGLVAVDRSSVHEHEGSLFALLFEQHQPRLRLSPGEQSLLEVAIGGLTDRELVERLGLSIEAVRSRWRTVLRKSAGLLRERGSDGAAAPPRDGAAAAEPLPAGAGAHEERITRGNQRRHHLLDYIREHREELRPFDWPLWDSLQAGHHTDPTAP